MRLSLAFLLPTVAAAAPADARRSHANRGANFAAVAPAADACHLRPGAPSSYAGFCNATTTQSQCDALNKTCEWGDGGAGTCELKPGAPPAYKFRTRRRVRARRRRLGALRWRVRASGRAAVRRRLDHPCHLDHRCHHHLGHRHRGRLLDLPARANRIAREETAPNNAAMTSASAASATVRSTSTDQMVRCAASREGTPSSARHASSITSASPLREGRLRNRGGVRARGRCSARTTTRTA